MMVVGAGVLADDLAKVEIVGMMVVGAGVLADDLAKALAKIHKSQNKSE